VCVCINSTDRNGFVGLRQHGDQHVDKHDHHTAAVASEHEFADELGQVVALVQSEDVDRGQAVHGKVQRLNDLEQAANTMHTISA